VSSDSAESFEDEDDDEDEGEKELMERYQACPGRFTHATDASNAAPH
jgi:hypothetical protein